MKVLIPDIGDFKDVAIIEILVATGDTVVAEDSLLILESDKATIEVPSPAAGKITALHVKVGDKVSQGSHIADLDAEAKTDSSSATDKPDKADKATKAVSTQEAVKEPAKESKTESKVTDAGKSSGASTSNTPVDVLVPDIGDFKNVAIIEIIAKVGDELAAEESILTLESDKATMDIPAPFAGTLKELTVKVGDKVNPNDLIARVLPASTTDATDTKKSAPSESAKPTPAPTETKTESAPSTNVASTTVTSTPTNNTATSAHRAYAGPSVRKFARELGVDINMVQGSGTRGRIIREDVQSYVKSRMQNQSSGSGLPTMPTTDFGQFGEIELKPIPRIRKLSASYLHRNWLLAPHVTQHTDADITDMEDFRKSIAEEAKKNGYKMTPLAFFIRAAVMALREFPDFNSSLHDDGEHLVHKKYFHIGIAVDTPGGLVVPVLRDADRKGLADIARELAEISERARQGKLQAQEMQGGCFTISSLGGIGGSYFTPIINLPEVAIMGVSRSQYRPQWNGKEFIPRLTLPLSLSYDHRVIDGAQGARFITYYASLLGDIRRLSL